MDRIKQHIQVIIFTATEPVKTTFIIEIIRQLHREELSQIQVQEMIDDINRGYAETGAVFSIVQIAGGYQLLTLREFDPIISHVQSNLVRKKLSNASLETLSIVVYKQPVTKAVIESIRGVNSDYALQRLLEKSLVKIVGRSEEVGRPLLYAAGDKFLEHFGLNAMTDLPKLKEFKAPEESIGLTEEE